MGFFIFGLQSKQDRPVIARYTHCSRYTLCNCQVCTLSLPGMHFVIASYTLCNCQVYTLSLSGMHFVIARYAL